MDDLAHWDCWGWHGEMEHVNRPTPNTTPEHAMNEVLSKARPWQESLMDASRKTVYPLDVCETPAGSEMGSTGRRRPPDLRGTGDAPGRGRSLHGSPHRV